MVCAVLGAALIAAAEEKERQCETESQSIASLQGLVKMLQPQLEEGRTNAHLVREELYERLMQAGDDQSERVCKNPLERKGKKTRTYPLPKLDDLPDHLEKLPVPLQPWIKTEYSYEESGDEVPPKKTKGVPFEATNWPKLKKEYGQTPK